MKLRALLLLAILSSFAHAEDLKVIRTTVSITCDRFGNYWPNPAAAEPKYNTWSWLPRSIFYLKGDMPPGAEVTISYMLADGSPWISVPCVPQKVGETNYYACGNSFSTQESGKPAKTFTGTFPFKITLKDPLADKTSVLYEGKYTVGKFHKGPEGDSFKNQFEYFVNQDWRMPIGFVSANYSGSNSDDPVLEIKLYLKGDVDQERIQGVLYFDDKMIASKELRGGGTYSNFKLSTSGMDTGDPLWGLWNFTFGQVRMFVPQFNKGPESWYLSEHPGKYEFKLLRNGTLARSMKFTIGDAAKIDDGGLGKSIGDEVNAIFPVKILGSTDGTWNADSWKEGSFYGNPIPSFDGSQ